MVTSFIGLDIYVHRTESSLGLSGIRGTAVFMASTFGITVAFSKLRNISLPFGLTLGLTERTIRDRNVSGITVKGFALLLYLYLCLKF